MEKLTGKKLSKYILEQAKECLSLGNPRIVRSEVLIDDLPDAEFVCGYWIDAFSKYGEQVVNCGVEIFWRRYTEVDERICASAPYPTSPLKKWENSALLVGFDRFKDDWPQEGISISDQSEIKAAASEICSIFRREGKAFLDKHATVQGMFDYLVEHPGAPGTWRPTLEFLLREKLFGTAEAGQFLRDTYPAEPTAYERHQRDWILKNLCPSIH